MRWAGRPRQFPSSNRQSGSIRAIPHICNRYRLMGYALLFLERYDEAIVWFQRSLAANPSDSARESWQYPRRDCRRAGARGPHRGGAPERGRGQPTLADAHGAKLLPDSNVTNPVLPHRSPACTTDCGSPAFAITPTRTPIWACRRMTSCTPTTKRRRRPPCRVHGPFGRLTWPRLVEQRKPLVLDTSSLGQVDPWRDRAVGRRHRRQRVRRVSGSTWPEDAATHRAATGMCPS